MIMNKPFIQIFSFIFLALFVVFCSVPSFAKENKDQTADKLLDDVKFGWTTQKERLRERKRLKYASNIIKEYEEYKINPIDYAFDSFLLPGRGQLNLEQKRKGWVIRISFFSSMFYGVYHLARSNDYYRSYKTASSLESIKDYYREANSSYKKAQLGLGIGTAIWIYNTYDAYKQAEAYNIALFNNIRLSSIRPNMRYDIYSEKFYLLATMEF